MVQHTSMQQMYGIVNLLLISFLMVLQKKQNFIFHADFNNAHKTWVTDDIEKFSI